METGASLIRRTMRTIRTKALARITVEMVNISGITTELRIIAYIAATETVSSASVATMEMGCIAITAMKTFRGFLQISIIDAGSGKWTSVAETGLDGSFAQNARLRK